MEKNVFWEVFRETGEPMGWLLTRLRPRADNRRDARTGEGKKPSRPR